MTLYFANQVTKKWEPVDDELAELLTALDKETPVSAFRKPYTAPNIPVPTEVSRFAKPVEAMNLVTLEKFMIFGRKHMEDLGFSPSGISLVCTGKKSYHKNHTFRFRDK